MVFDAIASNLREFIEAIRENPLPSSFMVLQSLAMAVFLPLSLPTSIVFGGHIFLLFFAFATAVLMTLFTERTQRRSTGSKRAKAEMLNHLQRAKKSATETTVFIFRGFVMAAVARLAVLTLRAMDPSSSTSSDVYVRQQFQRGGSGSSRMMADNTGGGGSFGETFSTGVLMVVVLKTLFSCVWNLGSLIGGSAAAVQSAQGGASSSSGAASSSANRGDGGKAEFDRGASKYYIVDAGEHAKRVARGSLLKC